jgi:putative transposase
MSFPRQVIPGRVYLVTRRCTQRQFLLRPDVETNNAFLYCLAYAANGAGIGVVAYIANSNHYHAVVVDNDGRIPRFLEDFHRLIAKHQNALRGRWENFWASEQTSLVELVGDQDVLAKTIYTLTNPVKDHLVASAGEWPGASSLEGTLNGKPLTAHRPTRFFRANGKTPERVHLTCVRAPGYDHLSDDDYAARLREAIAGVEAAAAAERRTTGRRLLGARAVLAQDPADRPRSQERRRCLDPHVAARDKLPRIEAILRLKAFRAAYAAARDMWLHAKGAPVLFPEGTWWLHRFAAVPCSSPDTLAA